ncbi:MAG: phosphatase PAP2 family protein, partial [Oscillospiraceae bacterium]|nr:phosphatase PAP2 family protein [Oscillospiraceae bacterium]
GVLLWLQQLRTPVADAFFSWYTRLGNAGLVWIALSLVMVLFQRTRKTGVLALFSLLFGCVCCNLTIKPLAARLRPWLVVEGLQALVAEHDPNSFPSGHSCAAFAAAGVWCRGLSRRWLKVGAIVTAALMAVSRLYVGVHFPSDVLAGALLGSMCAWVVWMAEKRIKRKLRP